MCTTYFIGTHVISRARSRLLGGVALSDKQLAMELERAVNEALRAGYFYEAMHEGKIQRNVDITDTLTHVWFRPTPMVAVLKTDYKHEERMAIVTVRPKKEGEQFNTTIKDQLKDTTLPVAKPTPPAAAQAPKTSMRYIVLNNHDSLVYVGSREEATLALAPGFSIFKECRVRFEIED